MQEIWSDPRYVGRAFMEQAKKLGFKPKDIQTFVSKQEGKQLSKDQRGTEYFPVWGQGPGSYQADLMFVNGKPILCVINVNSRFAYAYALTSKKAEIAVAPAVNSFLYDSRRLEVSLQFSTNGQRQGVSEQGCGKAFARSRSDTHHG